MIRSVHSRRSIAEILSRPVAFDSNNLDNKIKNLARFSYLKVKSVFGLHDIIEMRRTVSGVVNVVNKECLSIQHCCIR